MLIVIVVSDISRNIYSHVITTAIKSEGLISKLVGIFMEEN